MNSERACFVEILSSIYLSSNSKEIYKHRIKKNTICSICQFTDSKKRSLHSTEPLLQSLCDGGAPSPYLLKFIPNKRLFLIIPMFGKSQQI